MKTVVVHSFSKYSVKTVTQKKIRQIKSLVLSLVKTLLSRIFCLWKLFEFIATVFLQKFRQINVLQKNFTINSFDEKKLCEFLVFPHCCGEEINEYYFIFS